MSSLLDDLARSAAAEPMPRRRVMRILFGALVGATVPAVLRPGSAAAQTCHAPEFSCECPSPVNAQAHFQLCCPNAVEYTCECKPTEAICIHRCPESRQCGIVCCEPGQVCADAEHGTCCRSGETPCGSTCCGPEEECAHPELEYCCPAKWRKCGGGTTITCCPPTSSCCEGKCCPPGKVCHEGKCRKCPPKHHRCGDTECCKHGQECCGGRCCPEGHKCASVAGEKICCPNGRILRTAKGNACCPSNTRATKSACCPGSGPCDQCDEVVCLPGTYCINGTCYAL